MQLWNKKKHFALQTLCYKYLSKEHIRCGAAFKLIDKNAGAKVTGSLN